MIEMPNVIRGAINGGYRPLGDVARADCAVVLAFGAGRKGKPGHVNELLADYTREEFPGLPWIVQGEIADALQSVPDGTDADVKEPECIIRGNPSTGTGGELDSWKMLKEAGIFMRKNELRSPILVAQAFHVGRVAVQAESQGMNPIVPEGLPDVFDYESIQPWTRGRGLWVPRELGGMVWLQLHGKLRSDSRAS